MGAGGLGRRSSSLVNASVWAVFSRGRINNTEMAEKCLKRFCWVNFALVRKEKETHRTGHAEDGEAAVLAAPEAERMNTKEGKSVRQAGARGDPGQDGK